MNERGAVRRKGVALHQPDHARSPRRDNLRAVAQHAVAEITYRRQPGRAVTSLLEHVSPRSSIKSGSKAAPMRPLFPLILLLIRGRCRDRDDKDLVCVGISDGCSRRISLDVNLFTWYKGTFDQAVSARLGGGNIVGLGNRALRI